jgi:enhancing lycopene biosynthesis protein 2
MRVLPEVERIVREVRGAGRPMGFICIAPVIAARILGPAGVKLTIGNDRETAAAIESWGARHVDCKVEDAVVDERLKVASTPAYMLGPWIAPVATGIDKLVSAVLEMA